MNSDFNGITMILPLSLQRMDRLSLHFSRWKGEMSISIQCNEEEFETLLEIISNIHRKKIRFTFYLVKKNGDNNRCSFIKKNGKQYHLPSCYVINELRNLAIETIRTTHFMIIDGDAIISCIINIMILIFSYAGE